MSLRAAINQRFPRQRLASLSRDRRFLVRAGALIAAASIGLGLLISLIPKPNAASDGLPVSVIERFAFEVRQPTDTFDLTDFHDRVTASTLSLEEKALVNQFAVAMHSDDPADAQQALVHSPPIRFAAEFLGDVLMTQAGGKEAAILAYTTEVKRFPQRPSYAAGKIVRLSLTENRLEDLRKILRDPAFNQALGPGLLLSLAAKIPDYPMLWKNLLLVELNFASDWSLWALSAAAALIWLIIFAQFCGFQRGHILRYATAFGLGILSAVLTIFVVIWQDQIRGFEANEAGEVIDQFIYWIAGVALREELVKLLFFLPMIPFLLRRDDIDALICAAFVGLGFAFQENVGSGYFDFGIESALWSRFLTANFLHLALTGVAGLSLVRACRWPTRQWDDALLTVLLVIALHGGYNAVQSMTFFGEYGGFIAIIFLAVISWQFFGALDEHQRIGRGLHLSPLGVFVVGSALLCGIVFCYACWGRPFVPVLAGFIPGVANLIPVAFLYINQFRDL